ncbi:MAG: pantoate--beta-alanine ligase [Omnitrophica WOR_2 bacterium RIFCSPHIGHO2_02_FULL_50_17]|nr:MAG: pantoate--beta-alanine ligase [Omnitrophica WOR_2 bacterium RIFCSPHIGHO2_02_FULL_50_17]
MRVIRSVKTMQRLVSQARRQGKRVGFVPTMGALHEGHLSLMRRCRRENDLTVVSIFVNPAQFGPTEDFKAYPRPVKADQRLAGKAGVDILFYPSDKEMYPDPYRTYIEVEKMTENLCGKFRPGHFKGVATVVGKLLNIVQPDVLYLGQKDAQQAVVLKQMVRDLNFPVTVKVCPIVRGPDGAALSSRNVYLTPQERRQAAVLFRSLQEAKEKIQSGERSLAAVVQGIRRRILKETSGKIDYVACVNAQTLEPLSCVDGKILIALAVRFGSTRLIDNILVQVR